MTPDERAERLMAGVDSGDEVFRTDFKGLIAAAVREAVEDALLDASGVLADIAFSDDLTLEGVRNKARKCYERLKAADGTPLSREDGAA